MPYLAGGKQSAPVELERYKSGWEWHRMALSGAQRGKPMDPFRRFVEICWNRGIEGGGNCLPQPSSEG